MNHTCHTRLIRELTTNLESVPYTANAHPTRGRGSASPRDNGRLDVKGSSPDTPGSDPNPSGTAKFVRPRRSMITSAVSHHPPGAPFLPP
jgi:hypothetical protein